MAVDTANLGRCDRRWAMKACVEYNVSRAANLPGAAHLVLVDGVVHLDPEPAVFAAMLEGWALQQRARLDMQNTIGPRVRQHRCIG
ncbi:hypothetical protein AB0D57_18650 [Streptomyces sp. NPDC048275]|uniref:hypothetical protein n=1 Tax=Streptomyces sp. NPDC048275 TaxID=3155629 RepID=UPI0033C49460